MKIDETFAFNQSVGTSPVTYDFQKIKVSDGAISTANSFRILGWMLSGSWALYGLRLCRSFSTPVSVISMSGISGRVELYRLVS